MKITRRSCLLVGICFLVMIFSGVQRSVVSAKDLETGMAAHYTFDGNLEDSSGNGNNGTANGSIAFVNGPIGKAAVFDGKSYIQVADNSSLDLKNSFTISVWVYKNYNYKYGDAPMIVKTGESSDDDNSIALYDNQMTPVLDLNADSDNTSFESNKYVDMHKWVLETVTYDKKNLVFYTDGVQVKKDQFSGKLISAKGDLLIGMMLEDDVNRYFKGCMDDLRIYSSCLSPQEVAKLYSDTGKGDGKELVSKSKALVAYYKFNSNTQDSTGFHNNAKLTGKEVYDYAVQDKGLVFDGHTYLEVADSDSIDTDAGLTVSAWVLLGDLNTENSNYPLFERPDASAYDSPAFSFYAKVFGKEAAGSLGLSLENDSTHSPMENDADLAGIAGKWAMLTATYDKAANKITHYLNGVQIGATDADEQSLYHSDHTLVIGKDTGNNFFRGIMDEARIYNYALSAPEVKKLYTYRDTLQISVPAALKAKTTVKGKVTAISPENKSTDVTSVAKCTSSNSKIAVMTKGGLKLSAPGKTTLGASLGANYGLLAIKVK